MEASKHWCLFRDDLTSLVDSLKVKTGEKYAHSSLHLHQFLLLATIVVLQDSDVAEQELITALLELSPHTSVCHEIGRAHV